MRGDKRRRGNVTIQNYIIKLVLRTECIAGCIRCGGHPTTNTFDGSAGSLETPHPHPKPPSGLDYRAIWLHGSDEWGVLLGNQAKVSSSSNSVP